MDIPLSKPNLRAKSIFFFFLFQSGIGYEKDFTGKRSILNLV
jgi:hypothetical protein